MLQVKFTKGMYLQKLVKKMNKLSMEPIVIFIMIVPLFSCQRNADEHEKERLAVEEVLSHLIEADKRSDLEEVMNQYSMDAILMPPNDTSIIGWEAVKEHYRGLFDNFRFISLAAIPDEISISHDLAFIAGTTVGRIEAKDGSSSQEIHGKFVMLFGKNDNGIWKINRLIWNDTIFQSP